MRTTAETSGRPLPAAGAALGSAPYRDDNLLDRLTSPATLEHHYRHQERRERAILARRLALAGGEVLSVGCGWHPGRHLFPAPAFRLTAVDADPACVAAAVELGGADEAIHGHAGRLELDGRAFDVVLYRLVLHHIAHQGPLQPCFEEAARLLAPGGALVAIEPGLWHPVGAALALANAAHVATRLHGTPDDVPLSPRRLIAHARAAGLEAELHAVGFGWRRMAPALQRALAPLDELGSRPRLAPLGHTLMLIARAGTARRRAHEARR
ncbi:MAG TPA: class I SAM-dependent methyltransferase [Solirubrobacteraceae bacterium]|nr:class I SAM-dependent methyltransferase [Solirubrobacteraceae bacterium]